MWCYKRGYKNQFYFEENKQTVENKKYTEYGIRFSIIPPPREEGCYVNVWYNESLVTTLYVTPSTPNTKPLIKNEGWVIFQDGDGVPHYRDHYKILNRLLLGKNKSHAGIVSVIFSH